MRRQKRQAKEKTKDGRELRLVSDVRGETNTSNRMN